MNAQPKSLMLTVEESARQLRIGRTQMFALIRSGEITSVKVGRSRRIPAAALDEYVDGLIKQQSAVA